MFGSLKSLKACTAHIFYWLICHKTRNEEGVNVPCQSVLGLFGFRKVTYTPRRRKYMAILSHARAWLYDVAMSYRAITCSHSYNKVSYKAGYKSTTISHLLSLFIFIVYRPRNPHIARQTE